MTLPTVDIVTGATQGIGKAISECIATARSKNGNINNNNYMLVLVGRSEQRGTELQTLLQKSTNNNLAIHFASVDLSQWDQVQQLEVDIGEKLLGGQKDYRVGILVNSAAECPKRQQWAQLKKQVDGEEISVDKQFATNVLGYHFMMKAFQDHYSLDNNNNNNSIHPTHIVNVASTWAGSLDLSDISFQRRSYDNDDAYRQSKQADRMLSRLWSKQLQGKAMVNACHPGDPCTKLSKALGYNLFASAPTPKFIYRDSPIPFLCGLDPDGHAVTTTGDWFVGSGTRPSHCGFATKTTEAEKLFDLCESFCF